MVFVLTLTFQHNIWTLFDFLGVLCIIVVTNVGNYIAQMQGG